MLMAYNQIWGGKQPITAGDINPAYNMSGEKVSLVPAARNGNGFIRSVHCQVRRKAQPQLLGVQGALQGAKAGAKTAGALGAGFGAAQGMQNNETPFGVAVSAAKGWC